jgi:murein DD-endopeptidase MepM/ murein hydrolase activator NlpD
LIARVKLGCALFLVAGAVASTIAPTPALGYPQSQAEIEQRIEELKRLREQLDAREESVREGISDAGARRAALTHELEELQAITNEVQGRVDQAANALAGIQARLDAKTEALKKAERALESRLTELRRRAVQVYKHGPASLLDMVMGAEGFGDLVRRFSYMVEVIRTDNEHVASIKRTRAKIMRERDAVEDLRDRAAKQMAVVVSERNHAAAVERSVASERAAVSGRLQNQYVQLGDIQRQKEQYERETAELQWESAQIAALLRGKSSGEATVSPRGMIWPASGPVTSGFGWRTHPIFGTRRFHAGIDIGAPMGAPVVAAATGRVVYAGTQSGYGRHVIVDHGGGIATLYAHLSSISAGQGAVVARGAPVGRVGCTGYCTGPHLHFEVRVNGDPVNPLGWLP